MTETPRETRVLGAVVSLVDSLLVDFDVVELLTQLTEQCAQLLDVEAAAFCSLIRSISSGCWRRRPSRPANWSSSNCRPTKALVWTAIPPGSRCPSPTWRAKPSDGRGSSLPLASAGFAAVHAVPMRAAGVVMGALGLFGSRARRAQRGRPARRPNPCPYRLGGDPAGTRPDAHHRGATAARGVDQPRRRRAGKGLPARGPRGIHRAGLPPAAHLRAYHDEHLTDVARRLMTDRHSRPALLGRFSEIATAPTE